MESVQIRSGEQSDILRQKIAVITPHQDPKRKIFLNQLEKYISRQTIQPDNWIIVDDKTGLQKDITLRIKIGIDRAFESGCSIVLIMEDDDYYSTEYIETMLSNWNKLKKPDLLGIGYTYYYHIKIKKFHKLEHSGRASLMATLIHLPAMYRFKFPEDSFSFIDINLWRQLKGKTFNPIKPICVGIKHGIGNTGGIGHKTDWALYKDDSDWKIFDSLLGSDSDFYKNIFK